MSLISTSPADSPRPARRIHELDGLRGIAILLVVLYHYFSAIQIVPDRLIWAIARANSAGWIGVDIFFVLSGFLIGNIILKQENEAHFYLLFYLRRLARLMPLYLCLLGVYLLFGPILLATGTNAGRWMIAGFGLPLPAWSYVVYVQNVFIAASGDWGGQMLAPTWSLSIEEQFYLFAPVLILGLARRRLPFALGVMIAVSIVLRIVLRAMTGDWIPGYVLLPAHCDGLLIGIAGALAVQNKALVERLRSTLGNGSQFIIAALLAVSGYLLHYINDAVFSSLVYTLLALFSLLLILSALYAPRSMIAKLLRLKALRALGEISYGIYLLHQGVHGIVHFAFDGLQPQLRSWVDVLLALLAMALTVCLARLSWDLMERPILAWSKRAIEDVRGVSWKAARNAVS